MNQVSALDHLLLGSVPMVGRWREPAGLRLKLLPTGHQTRPDAEGLVKAMREAFATPPGAEVVSAEALATPSPALLLDVVGTPWVDRLLDTPWTPGMGLALPVEVAQDAALCQRLRDRRAAGGWLVARARSWAQVPASAADVFAELLVDAREGDLSAGRFAGPTWVEGVPDLDQVDRVFDLGAKGVIGWPRQAARGVSRDIRAEVPVVVDLMNRVERQEPLERLERALKTDPTLVFRLLRHINSAALGLKIEVTALRQALMLLGYLPLLRWLSRMLLDAAAKEGASRPLVHLSVRRGFLMEHLAAAGPSSGTAGAAAEMFLCGMFSLLDVILQRPLAELVGALPLPERVRASLLEPDGPYSLHLRWVEAVETGSVSALRAALDGLRIGPRDANLALLQGLAAARTLDG
jgi:EAL and modified HD-GYP domain-containing signal transduction protein